MPSGEDLRLMPGTIAIFDAELAGDLDRMADLLQVTGIGEWPPLGGEHDAGAVSFFRESLVTDPSLADWSVFYVCLDGELVGSAGFMGRPVAGVAEIGYSICQSHRRRGIATRVAGALVERARAGGANEVIARTTADNAASIAVVQLNGFELAESTPAGVLYRLLL